MKYCSNCGQQIDKNAVVCIHCGVSTSNYQSPNTIADNGGLGWGVLGCCIPLVGLILYLVWKDQKPRTSKAAGTGALVAVGFWILIYVVFIIIAIVAADATPSYYY